MFIFELLIYIFFALVMYYIAKKSLIKSEQGEITCFDRYIFAYLVFFTIVSAIRWRVGVDSQAYIDIFKSGVIRNNSTEYIWDILVKSVHDNGLPFYVGTAAAAFFQIYFLYKGLKDYKYLLMWLPIVMFGGRYYIDLMNGVRQMMVMCGFFYLSTFLVKKKVVIYVIGIFILSFIHQSALILLPMCLFAFVPLDKLNLPDKKYVGLGILIACFVIGRTPLFQGVMRHLENVLTLTGYGDTYIDYYAQVLSGKYTEALSMGPIMISYLLTGAVLIWYGPELKEYYGEKIPYFNLWYFFSFIYSCGYFLVCNLSHMMIRPFQYFEVFQAVLLTMILNYFYQQGENSRYALYALIIIIWSCTVIGVYKDTGQPIEFTTYKIFFNHI